MDAVVRSRCTESPRTRSCLENYDRSNGRREHQGVRREVRDRRSDTADQGPTAEEIAAQRQILMQVVERQPHQVMLTSNWP